MHKFHNSRLLIPNLVANIISMNAPKDINDAENCNEWLASHSTQKLRNALSFKGPLFYMKYLPKIMSQDSDRNVYMSVKSFKTKAKSFALKIQSEGRALEWEGQNTPLYHVPGLPRSSRENIPALSYISDLD